MFTGIIQAVGRIVDVESRGDGRRLRVQAVALDLHEVRIGDSICIDGACMTVTQLDGEAFEVDVSAESLARTSGLDRIGPVNLEKSLRLGDRLDGHLVSGHVDGTGIVRELSPAGESWTLVVEVPGALAASFAYKGSVAIHGVSLTVNRVDDVLDGGQVSACRITINLIPHTVAATTLGGLRVGDAVNVEVDPLARYVARALALGQGTALPGRSG